ncbi:MAG TPA: zf-HC2 domain-containing protein [Bryobacteraceae bacterium]|nr:zf-HC2 domain-containing protein [Bryobacteraceae bacterium]
MIGHAEATKRFAVEQYLLGEMGDPEREEFENHFFSCPECLEALEAGAAFLSGARAVMAETPIPLTDATRRERRFSFSWLSRTWVPAAALAACAVLAALAGYQNFVQIPALRHRMVNGSALAILPSIRVTAARAEQDLTFSRGKGAITLFVAHEWEESYPRYECEVEQQASRQVISEARIAEADTDFMVSLKTSRLSTGAYLLTIYGLRGTQKAVVTRVPFRLTE